MINAVPTGFGAAAMIHPDGKIDDKVVASGREGAPIVRPQPNDFADASKNEPLCMILDEGRTFVALRKLQKQQERAERQLLQVWQRVEQLRSIMSMS